MSDVDQILSLSTSTVLAGAAEKTVLAEISTPLERPAVSLSTTAGGRVALKDGYQLLATKTKLKAGTSYSTRVKLVSADKSMTIERTFVLTAQAAASLPAPTADPVPAPPVSTDSTVVTIDGQTRPPALLDTLVTRSGHWSFYDLGTVRDCRAYLWLLAENPAFIRVQICRRSFTLEAGDTADLDVSMLPVEVSHRGETYSWMLSLAQGAVRVVQNMEPVPLNADWLRQAVADKRIPAYRRERAWSPPATPEVRAGSYDPASLGPTADGSTPSSNNNYVGVTSGQGGEYDSSRGFIHNYDAMILDAALQGEDEKIAGLQAQFTQFTLYSLAQPAAAVWSTANHVTADPQMPMPGDRAYEYAAAGARVRSDIDSVWPVTGWGRDEAHLENTGFVHWIATEDPIAGMVVQRQLAFHLSNFYEYQRPTPQTAYGIQVIQERGLYNALSALWKSRDVAHRVSGGGRALWGAARVDQMAADGIASIAAQTSAYPARDVAAVTGAVLRGIGVMEWATVDGGKALFAAESAFEGFEYGKEPMWLWAKAGNATVAAWLKAKARQAVVRALYIGGALGVDRAEDVRGSAYPLGPATKDKWGVDVPAPTPFNGDVGWADWVVEQPIATQARDRFDASTLHTVVGMYGMLLLAKDAGVDVAEIDDAIARMEADRGRTTAFRWPEMLTFKHLGGPA